MIVTRALRVGVEEVGLEDGDEPSSTYFDDMGELRWSKHDQEMLGLDNVSRAVVDKHQRTTL